MPRPQLTPESKVSYEQALQLLITAPQLNAKQSKKGIYFCRCIYGECPTKRPGDRSLQIIPCGSGRVLAYCARCARRFYIAHLLADLGITPPKHLPQARKRPANTDT